MKKQLVTALMFLSLSTCTFAQDEANLAQQVQNKNNTIVNIMNSMNNGITTQKIGRSNIIFDYMGNILGSYRKTPSGKHVVYNAKGKKVGSFKVTPSGYLSYYDNNGNRIRL